jgi:hypothetical protein
LASKVAAGFSGRSRYGGSAEWGLGPVASRDERLDPGDPLVKGLLKNPLAADPGAERAGKAQLAPCFRAGPEATLWWWPLFFSRLLRSALQTSPDSWLKPLPQQPPLPPSGPYPSGIGVDEAMLALFRKLFRVG